MVNFGDRFNMFEQSRWRTHAGFRAGVLRAHREDIRSTERKLCMVSKDESRLRGH